jgi:hypothetical protein
VSSLEQQQKTDSGMKSSFEMRWKGKPPPVEAFEPVAQLITPKPPTWLKEHLRRWLPMYPYAVEILQPSRAEMRAILTKVAEAE